MPGQARHDKEERNGFMLNGVTSKICLLATLGLAISASAVEKKKIDFVQVKMNECKFYQHVIWNTAD